MHNIKKLCRLNKIFGGVLVSIWSLAITRLTIALANIVNVLSTIYRITV